MVVKIRERKNAISVKLFVVIALIISMCLSVLVNNTRVYATENEEVTLETKVLHVSQKEKPENINQKGYDVVFVIDNSRSVWSHQAERNQAFKNISNLAVGTDIRIGAVFFANQIYSTLSLTSMETKENSQKVLDFLNMTAQDGSNIATNMGNAFEEALKLFEDQDSSRERIVVLFSDGINEGSVGANEKTAEQVEILKSMNIPIYCVYLQMSRNDEAYLKDVVNYFDDSNDYVGERFVKVESQNISSLSKTFINVFYKMQGNMKYREITFDSSGEMNFYVPSLGIDMLRVYLEGNLSEGTITPAGESEVEKWNDGSSVFLVYSNPVPGEWSINVRENNSSGAGVNGTLAYYTNISAAAELMAVGDKKQIVIHFYNKEGKEISVDEMAQISLEVQCLGDDGVAIESIPVATKLDNGVVVSEPFDLNSYGTYAYKINLSYDEYIYLSYTLDGITLEKHAPVVSDLSGLRWDGIRTDNGFEFNIDENELWSDPEGENVTIMGINQFITDNPVSFEQNGGKVYFVSAKSGKVNYELSLMDSSGMTTTVKVDGEVIDRVAIIREIITGLIVLLIVLFLAYFFNPNGKRRRDKLDRLFDEFNELISKYWDVYHKGEATMSEVSEKVDDINLYLEGHEEQGGLKDISRQLPEEVRKIFGVEKYADSDYRDDVCDIAENLLADVDQTREDIKELNVSVGGIVRTKKNTSSVTRKMEQNIESAKDLLESLKKRLEHIHNINTKMDERIESIQNDGSEVLTATIMDIECDLSIDNIYGREGLHGYMSATNIRGDKIKGFYRLGDVPLLVKNSPTLEKTLNTVIDIIVYAYEDEDTEERGLQLASLVDFEIIDKTNGNILKDAVLLKGKKYTLSFKTDMIGPVSMELDVK